MTAAETGSALVKIRTRSLPSTSSLAAREPSALNWWLARPRDWEAIHPPPEICPRPGSRLTRHRRESICTPRRSAQGAHAGKVAVSWQASDLHLADRSVSLFWRSDQPGSPWQPIPDGQAQENTGQFIWAVPPDLPPKFHIRAEAIDTVGNRGGAETTDSGPVIVDRSRPRIRILGLDPNARAGPSTQ